MKNYAGTNTLFFATVEQVQQGHAGRQKYGSLLLSWSVQLKVFTLNRSKLGWLLAGLGLNMNHIAAEGEKMGETVLLPAQRSIKVKQGRFQ